MEALGIPLTPVAVAVTVILLTVIYYFFSNYKVLPGPYGVPYLGLYPFLKHESFHRQLEEYKKKYGDVYSFTYSGRLFINLGSVKAMRELHVNQSDCFTERFEGFNVLTLMLGKGVTMINGEPWKILRKYFIQRFRVYGLNTDRDNMGGPVYDSLNATIEDLKAVQGKPIDVVNLLTQRCNVTIRKVIFGEEGITDEELSVINTAYGEAMEGTLGLNMILIGPFARLKFALKPELRKAVNAHDRLCNVIRAVAKKIELTVNDENPTCIMEDFYSERNKRRRNNDPTWKMFTEDCLVHSVLQFAGDGILGVASFIGGFLNGLQAYPEEEEKLYKELMEIIGPNRQPVLEDKPKLPYFNAFMNEVLRESTFLYVFPSLQCTAETTIRGYRIPKGSITLLNFWSAHHDSDTFEDPYTFNPSRYLSDTNKSKEESPVIFGIGKRTCFGEHFVMAQCFLFLATIVKNFKIIWSNDASSKSLDFLVTGQLELTFKLRTEN